MSNSTFRIGQIFFLVLLEQVSWQMSFLAHEVGYRSLQRDRAFVRAHDNQQDKSILYSSCLLFSALLLSPLSLLFSDQLNQNEVLACASAGPKRGRPTTASRPYRVYLTWSRVDTLPCRAPLQIEAVSEKSEPRARRIP